VTKVCFKCGQEKPLEAFYRHPQMADGRLNKCKECTKNDTKSNRNEKLEYYQAYDRSRGDLPNRIEARKAYQGTSQYRESSSAAKQRYMRRYPAKTQARNAVNNALRDGRLTKLPCEVCGSAESEAHHDDYSKPLEVRWLCDTDHKAWHKAERERRRQEAA
jgi:hypothetical protein